jgi:hypothetical protein
LFLNQINKQAREIHDDQWQEYADRNEGDKREEINFVYIPDMVEREYDVLYNRIPMFSCYHKNTFILFYNGICSVNAVNQKKK